MIEDGVTPLRQTVHRSDSRNKSMSEVMKKTTRATNRPSYICSNCWQGKHGKCSGVCKHNHGVIVACICRICKGVNDQVNPQAQT